MPVMFWVLTGSMAVFMAFNGYTVYVYKEISEHLSYLVAFFDIEDQIDIKAVYSAFYRVGFLFIAFLCIDIVLVLTYVFWTQAVIILIFMWFAILLQLYLTEFFQKQAQHSLHIIGKIDKLMWEEIENKR